MRNPQQKKKASVIDNFNFLSLRECDLWSTKGSLGPKEEEAVIMKEEMGEKGTKVRHYQCSQPSGGRAGPRGGTAKSPGRDGTASCSPSRPP